MKKIIIISTALFIFSSCRNSSTENKTATENNKEWMMTGFVKVDSINPILMPSKDYVFHCPLSNKNILWQQRNVLNPAALVKDGQVYLFYRAQDSAGTSRIGIATSSDGLHFTKAAAPVLFPAEDSMKKYEWNKMRDDEKSNPQKCKSCFDGVEDPRIVENPDGSYIMTYTAYDGTTARLCLASSKDLQIWTKHGPVLSAEKYKNTWSKSGAIVCSLQGGKMLAVKINGSYWMYFGDTNLFMATSTDLTHWTVAENEESQKMIEVLHPRMGYFDSRLTEPGPYALLKDEGILLIYNGSNAANFNDSVLPKFTYSAGQALFDRNKPYKLIDRCENYFIHPDKEYEKTGEVNEVCFVEGMVYFHNKWFLYYGTADSKIAVAVRDGGKSL